LTPGSVEVGAQFGFACDLSFGFLVVGSHDETQAGGAGMAASGSAYIWHYGSTVVSSHPGSWGTAQQVTSIDNSSGDMFGYDVAVDASPGIGPARVVVGAFGAGSSATYDQANGAAYLFEVQADETWLQQDKLFASDGSHNDRFGFAVAVSGGNILVGARGDDDDGSNSGSSYALVLPSSETGEQVVDPPAWVAPTCSSCSSFAEFYQCTIPMNLLCCDDDFGEDCSGGAPSTCSRECAAEVGPIVVACADFLATKGMEQVGAMVRAAQSVCNGH
jgi:hypothetical protein